MESNSDRNCRFRRLFCVNLVSSLLFLDFQIDGSIENDCTETDEMLLNHFPKPFLEDLLASRCVPIIGAGLSMNAVISGSRKSPSWLQLAQHFANQLPAHEFTTPLESISEYEHKFGRAKLVETLIDYIGVHGAQLGESQKSFCRLPFEWVVTTNFDTFLEEGYQSEKVYCKPFIDESDLVINSKLATGNQVNLFKLHGDLHHPSRLIITEEDYEGFLDRHRLACTFLANQLIIKTPLFVGYSVDDPHFRQLWRILKDRLGGLSRQGYAIRMNTSPQMRERFERRGIMVIDLPGDTANYDFVLAQAFTELASLLSELRRPHSKKKFVDKSCLISTSAALLPLYRRTVIPVAEYSGFQVIIAPENPAPEENHIARAASLVENSDAVIKDVTSAWDFDLAVMEHTKPFLSVSFEGVL